MISIDMGTGPNPDEAADLAEFIELVDQLRTWAGAPSFRTLAKRAGPLMRPPRTVSHSTVGEVFKRDRRRLDLDLVLGVIRALGADEPAVDRWRTAFARVQRDVKTGGPTGVLRQLPADLATFTGRAKELAFLVGAAADDAGTVVISAIEGMAGIGKTQLAVHAAHRLVQAGRYPDVQLYANLRGFDPDHESADPAAVLDVFLRQLGVPAGHVPAGLDERAAMFRDRMQERRALVLLDNAADETQVRPLLPAAATCLVLVTSRRSLAALEGARTVTLDVLSPAESVELLARIVGADRVAAEPRAAAGIAEICGGLPLAVSIAAARLRSRPAWTLDYLAGRLGRGLGEVASGRRDLARVFDLSYQGLPAAARHVFRLLGVHPGVDVTAASVTALADLDRDEAERILELLHDERLVQQKVPDRYELHDLVRAYAAERACAQISEQQRADAVSALLKWYSTVAATASQAVTAMLPPPVPVGDVPGDRVRFPGSQQALKWHEQERANLSRSVSTAVQLGLDDVAACLPVAMARFEEVARNWRECERLLRAALPHARRCSAPQVEIQVLSQLGFTFYHENRSELALDPLKRALDLCRKHGDPAHEERVLNVMALAYTGIGDHERGLEFGLRALSLDESIGADTASMHTMVLNTVAICLHEMGRTAEALEYVTAGIESARAQNHERVIGVSLHNLGFLYLALDRLAEAVASFEEAVAVARAIGDRYIHSDSLNGIARALQRQGLLSEARSFHRRALSVFDDLSEAEAARYRSLLDASPLRYEEQPEPRIAGALGRAIRP